VGESETNKQEALRGSKDVGVVIERTTADYTMTGPVTGSTSQPEARRSAQEFTARTA